MTDEPVVVVDYDPEWPLRFAAERDRLREALGEGADRIDHVGSTSVPGLAAKPIIDIQVSVTSFEPPSAYDTPLRSIGYEPGNHLPDHRFYIRRSNGMRLFHVHICEAGKDWESDHLLFREFLKANPAIAEKYGEVKRQKAELFRDDRDAYWDAKAPHVQGIMAAARRWFESTTIHGP